MLSLYSKKLVKKKIIEVDEKYDFFSTPSVFSINKFSNSDPNLKERQDQESLFKFAVKSFRFTFVNLILSKIITVEYQVVKTSLLFNLINYNSESFMIILNENYYSEDTLSNEILSVLKNKINCNLKFVVNSTINNIIGKVQYSKPENKYFYEYLFKFGITSKWIRIKPNNKFFGLITNYDIEIDKNKEQELITLFEDYRIKEYLYRKSNILFRKFIEDIEEVVENDLRSRCQSD